MPTCVRGKCVVVRSVNRLYGTVHRRTLMHVDLRRRKSLYRPSTCRMCRRTAPYARLTQGTQGPKQASNLTHVDHATHSSHVTDHFLSTLLSSRYMHCIECCWKSRLMPAVLCWKARWWWQQDVARRAAHSAWITHGMLAHFMERLHRPIAVVCDNLRFLRTTGDTGTGNLQAVLLFWNRNLGRIVLLRRLNTQYYCQSCLFQLQQL